MIFNESDLHFNFNDTHWQIIQYDTHRYYKILSGAGLKGVDFLGILNQQEVVYFEVKNYHSNHPTKESNFLVLEDSTLFIQRIADKMEDTYRGIEIIISFLRRKLWYRMFLKWEKYIPSFIVKKNDWYFWHLIHQIGRRKEQQLLVLWLEIDNSLSPTLLENLKTNIDKNLESELLAFVKQVEIADKKHPIFKDSLVVE